MSPMKNGPGQPGPADKSTPAPGLSDDIIIDEGLKSAPPGEPSKLDKKALDPNAKIEEVFGGAVPDKYKGKTLKEFLELHQTTEAALTVSKKENAEWLKHFQETEKQGTTGKKEPVFDPLEHLGEDQAKAVGVIVGHAVKPIYDSLGALMLEYTKTTRPDFEEYADRVKEIYNSLPPGYQFHPSYGWDFAYRFAKAEAAGVAPPPGPRPPELGPSGAGVDEGGSKPKLTKDQLYIAQRMGMTPEEYIKYQEVVDITAQGGK